MGKGDSFGCGGGDTGYLCGGMHRGCGVQLRPGYTQSTIIHHLTNTHTNTLSHSIQPMEDLLRGRKQPSRHVCVLLFRLFVAISDLRCTLETFKSINLAIFSLPGVEQEAINKSIHAGTPLLTFSIGRPILEKENSLGLSNTHSGLL